MTRTFYFLAVITLFLIVATLGMGLWSFVLDRSTLKENVFLIHFYLGLGTSLAVLFVHCIIFTYFLGTGRWVKEVGIAYRLPDQAWPRTTRELKRRVFPPALYSMLIVIAASAAGMGLFQLQWHWSIHLTLALLTLAINAWAIGVEHDCLTINARVIQEVLEEVERRRQAEGLEPSATALAHESQPGT